MAGKKERQRRRARERYQRQAEQRAVKRQTVRKRTGIGAIAAVVAGLIALVVVLATAGGGKSSALPKSSTKPTASPSATATTVAEPAHHCTYTTSPPAAKAVGLPAATPDYTAKYQATVKTNRGEIVINLANDKATCTVNSFIHLASTGYWANSQCHRASNSGGLYMVQCGDPYATASTKLTCASSSKIGTGGPGYQFASENLTGATYPAGTLAMANSGSATSNGGQFFLVFKNTSLPAQYTPFGTITSGLDILQNVANSGYTCQYQAGGGAPKENLIIDSVAIKKL